MKLSTLPLVVVLAACVSTKPPVAPTGSTSPDLAARRAQMIAWLHDYAQAGQFPQDAAGHPLSVFKDARGVRCPMAELIFRSGHGDLVEAVARTHNDLRLADVHDGPLYAWIVESGLTQEEIAMVQGVMTAEDLRGIEGANGQIVFIQNDVVKLASEWGQVRGHLATVETALRVATLGALQVAQTRRAPRTTPASKRTLETMR